MSSIYDWSQEADKNGNSDELINWEPGQPPSSVNGSARAMMKRIAEYINDLSGTILATGDGNSITVNLSSNVTKYIDGLRFYFKANLTNTKAMQLRINALPLLPVYYNEDKGLEETTKELCYKDGLYEIIYSSHLSKNGGWFLVNPTKKIKAPLPIPPGVIIHYADKDFNQEDWLICDGRSVDKNKYANLYKVIGNKWGDSPQGKDYFVLPDFRGVFLRGWDNGKGKDPNREFGSFQESSNKKHTHKVTCEESGAHTHEMLGGVSDNKGHSLYPRDKDKINGQYMNISPPPIKESGAHTHTITLEEEGGAEARPANYSLLYLIKT